MSLEFQKRSVLKLIERIIPVAKRSGIMRLAENQRSVYF